MGAIEDTLRRKRRDTDPHAVLTAAELLSTPFAAGR